MRHVRTIMATGALLAVTALAATACGSQEPNSADAVPVTSVAAAPSANAYSDSDGGSGSGGIAQAPDVAVPAPEVPTAASSPAASPVPTRDYVNVDAGYFEFFDGEYFFQSPSGNIFCGFNSANAPGTKVGCQVRYSVPGNTGRVCGNVANHTYGVRINQDSTIEQICTNQGIFLPSDLTRDVPVLEYGQAIGAAGTACRSAEDGVTCYDGNRGFTISRDVNIAF